MDTKHTPGPWRLHDMEADAIVAKSPHGGAEVANVANSCWRQNMKADARLIAAAPDLLEAAKYALANMPAHTMICEMGPEPGCCDCAEIRAVLRAAIAKATGTDEMPGLGLK